MKDISLLIDKYYFNFRVCALIEFDDKFLMEKRELDNYITLPGGRVKEGETTQEAISREVLEELGVNNLNFKLIQVNENFFENDNQKCQELNFVYYAKVDESNILTQKNHFRNLDNLYEELFWLNKNELSNYKILPENFYNLKGNQPLIHIINIEKK